MEERQEDLRASDVVLFSVPLRSAVNFVIRLLRFSLTEFAEKLPDFSREEVKRIADLLLKRRLFDLSRFATEAEPYYEARLSAMTRPLVPQLFFPNPHFPHQLFPVLPCHTPPR